MKILFVFLLFSSIEANAGLGRAIVQDQAFGQLCLLDFGSDSDRYTEICSGVLVDQKTILTAAHCVSEGLPRAISCGPQASKVDPASIQIHPEYSARWSVGNTSYLKNDLAVIKLTNPVPAQAVPLMTFGNLDQVEQCAFFGFSKFSMISRVGQPTPQIGWEIEKSTLDYWDELGAIRMYGLKAGGGLSEVGDSGGPLLCRQKNGQWHLLGIASSRDFAYHAYFTPVVTDRFAIKIKEGSQWLQAEAERLKAERTSAARARMLDELIQKMQRTPKIAKLVNQISGAMSYQEAYHLALRGLFDRPGETGRLKAFSTFQKAGDSKVYSVGDLAFNYFTVDSIDFKTGYAEGTLQVLGPSENFMCHGDLLCRDETIHKVRTRIENLSIYLK